MTEAVQYPDKPCGSQEVAELTSRDVAEGTKLQLEYWIKEINKVAGKKLLNVSAKNKEELRTRLAQHLDLDISDAAVKREIDAVHLPATGPPTQGHEIQRRQWAHMRNIGQRWRQAMARGEEFTLLHRALPSTDSMELQGQYISLSHLQLG